MGWEQLNVMKGGRILAADVRCRVKRSPGAKRSRIEFDLAEPLVKRLGWKLGDRLTIERGTGDHAGLLRLSKTVVVDEGAPLLSAGKNVRAMRITMARDGGLEKLFPPSTMTTAMEVLHSTNSANIAQAHVHLTVRIPARFVQPADAKGKGAGA